MKRVVLKFSRLLAMFGVVGVITACADDPSQPNSHPAARFAATESSGRYIVDFAGKGPANFAARVAAMGGTVEFAHAEAGLATVSGLTGLQAAQLARLGGIAGVYVDQPLQLAPRVADIDVEPLTAEASSAANPATSLLFNRQWNMRVIGAHTAWAAGQLGSPAVTVAILDSGIDYENLDLAGLVDLANSRSFVPSDDAFMDTWLPGRHKIEDLNGHGTNVAATVSSNGAFFGAVNSFTRLLGVKVLGRTGSGSFAGVFNGLIYAADQGADVANMSLGIEGGVTIRRDPKQEGSIAGGSFLAVVNKVLAYTYRQGMVVVVSAGNDAANMDNEGQIFRAFCEAPHVICVSATGPTASANVSNGPWINEDALAGYSNYGKAITVAAPGGTAHGFIQSVCARRRVFGFVGGVPVFSCLTPTPGSAFIVGYGGTSQAAPHVAGLAAKLVEKLGANNPAQIKHALVKGGVDDLGPAGADPQYGAGRINVAKAVGL